jgi:carboxymethylenebutenolidase
MCYGDDARPPAPPVQGPIGAHGDLTLTSADGTQFLAYEAHPDGGSDRGVVILPDVRGLHRFYKELCLRFAEAGAHAIAFDYFGRTAGLTPRGDHFDYSPHVAATDFDKITEDAAAAFEALGATSAIYSLGFCFGGAMSWRQSASSTPFRGNIGFYGAPSRVTDVIDRMRRPILILAAGQDHTPVFEVDDFAGKVRQHGVEVDMTLYPDAPHSFFDRKFEQYQRDCDDAWLEMLAFMDRHVEG